MRRFLAVAVVIAAFGIGVTSASAKPPSFKPAEQQCSRLPGSTFVVGPTEITPNALYACFVFGARGPLSEQELAPIRAMCENVYGGVLNVQQTSDPSHGLDLYQCTAASA